MPLQHDLIVQNKRQAFRNFPPPKIISPSGSSLSRRQMSLRRGGVKSSLDSCSPGQQPGLGNDFASLEKRRCLEGKGSALLIWGTLLPTQKFPSVCLYLPLRIRRSVLNFACTWAREPREPRLRKGGREGRLEKEWPEPRSS